MMGRPSRVALQIMIDTHTLKATVEELLAETDEIFPDILRSASRADAGPGRTARRPSSGTAFPKPSPPAAGGRLSSACCGKFDYQPRFSPILTSRGHHPRQAASGDLPQGGRAARHSSRPRCSCSKTARTAAGPRWPPAPSPSPCPALTAGDTISPARRWSPTRWRTGGFTLGWGSSSVLAFACESARR